MPINFIPNLDSTLLLDEILTLEGEKKGVLIKPTLEPFFRFKGLSSA